jgi:hypothetical protein
MPARVIRDAPGKTKDGEKNQDERRRRAGTEGKLS